MSDPYNKRFDESGRPIRYSRTVSFTDKAGNEWLRHEYLRWDKKITDRRRALPVVMEFEFVGKPKVKRATPRAYIRLKLSSVN